MNGSGWHVEKTVSVGHIITTLSIGVSVIWWASTVETRIAVNTQKIAASEAMIKRQDDSVGVIRQEMRADFDKLNNKIDRLIERGR